MKLIINHPKCVLQALDVRRKPGRSQDHIPQHCTPVGQAQLHVAARGDTRRNLRLLFIAHA